MSIAQVVAIMHSAAIVMPMAKDDPKRGKVTPENRAESAKLRALWDAHKAKTRISQGAFGAEYDIGGQSAVGNMLNAEAAISLKAARGFAKGLGCKIADFSERLAALDTAWPFELVDRDRYEALSLHLQAKAQIRMMDEIEAIEREITKQKFPEKASKAA